MLDLFSFDVPGGGRHRFNLESLFHKYEVNIESHTASLLKKLAGRSSDIKTEIVDLFAAKRLNFIRNPFCIEKVLSSFAGVAGLKPTDADLPATYRRIPAGRKPHQAHLCSELCISDQKYSEWLRLLFMLLAPLGSGQPILYEGVVKDLLENRRTHIATFVGVYDEARCLLSDRRFSQPIPDGAHIAMSFNLCAHAFIDYVITDPTTLLGGRVRPESLTRALASWEQRPMATINVTVRRNDRNMLVRYNRRVIEQCYKRV
jgi:hypothetical protein